ncbi:permease [Jiangella ureilytica]|uniref:Permease n=1 Tax=Jiangella ureilytica TaxID=2530374 RepID=A0A4R4RK25_9ACTN|nr:permease [Jiangella ureilytica]TDC49724.1 permease [Jiangella ureilytica]
MPGNGPAQRQRRPRRLTAPPLPAPERYAPELLMLALLAAVVAQSWAATALDHPAVQTWATIFVSITVQALPFLALGVTVSGAIAAFVPSSLIARLLPDRPLVAVPAAGVAGAVFPGCECGSVPVAGRLTANGAAPAAAFAFMLAAPAINPVVLVATAVAFPGRPDMVVARLLASFATAVAVGFLWARFGRREWLLQRRPHPVAAGSTRWEVFAGTARHDFLHAGGWLVVGSLAAATLQVVVPRSIMTSISETEWLAVVVLATLAVVLAICSEADAFVAASLSQFSLTARLVFLVVGPVVDIKLIALHAGIFGRSFAIRFAPLTFVTAVVSALGVGWWLL